MTIQVDRLKVEALQRAIAEQMAKAGIEPEDVGGLTKVGMWQAMSSDPDTGEHIISDLVRWEISPKFADGPAWELPAPAAPVKIDRARARTLDTGTVTVLCVPDAQVGWHRPLDDDEAPWVPTHDPQALDVAVQVAAVLRPHHICHLGDHFDGAEWSTKFVRSPTMAATTNRSIQTIYEWLAQFKAVAPEAQQSWIAGNHEHRITNLLMTNAQAAFGVKRPGERWPSLSVPALCRLDELNVEWIGGYPAGSKWFRPDIRAVHGKRLSAQRAAKDPVAVTTVQGHIHRLEVQSRTHTLGPGDFKHTLAISAGTLARVDGATPGFGSGLDEDGMPVVGNEAPDWAQGLVVLQFTPDGTEPPAVELVPIVDGTCRFRGVTYTAAG